MKNAYRILLAISCVVLVACHKKGSEASASASAAAATEQAASTATTSTAKSNESAKASAADSASSAEPTEQQAELAKKKALMEYATMEDRYINDSKGQWANGAKASTTFGDDNSSGPSSVNAVANVKGGVDGKTWTNNNQDIGFDWLETTYEKPVSATDVRVVFENGAGVEAINKISIQSTDGKWNTVWDGISDQKRDQRGNRTWFVRSFDRTSYKVKAVKISIANNMERGYKVIDAVQLVGD
ncbi:hypothetical protein [Undibacterium flavidum]|uniref:F5/8 type C domain-containing protein n=1 Tax=Undibacterium flavidum TaxID=2762297 RepID=A0ABR6YBX1_9BURK|nr:hypothetical protein [Undibacterium flavidum]MBC3873787.1 hypothetical protein [Undibacterium flavidum]